MKRVLIIKMSSMGDVIHTLPALTDVQKHFPEIQFDWVVEPGFAEIPTWHHAVREVIKCPLRQWRKAPLESYKKGEWHAFIRRLRYTQYDAIIDAQGLIKSALIAQFARGHRYGLNRKSAREPLASLFYNSSYGVEKNKHAVERTRQLFASVFHYSTSNLPPNYGIDKSRLIPMNYGDNTILFLHGTTWPTKHWPQSFWQRLSYIVSRAGFEVLLPWGNEIERERAQSIRDYNEQKGLALPIVLPKLNLSEITTLIARAKGIVAVDTGLGHIAAAMGTPTISLYGPTNPNLTGAYGDNQHHLKGELSCSPCLARLCKKGPNNPVQPPCFEALSPERVWQSLLNAMNSQPTEIKITTRKQVDAQTEIL